MSTDNIDPPGLADTVDHLILGHLDSANLPEPATNLLYGALLGPEEFAAALGGTTIAEPATARDEAVAEPIGTYLSGIEVTGFRGIGATATLNLRPTNGLTIVTGRNGSGKSSFAEAAELALTGENKRWAGRTAIWKDGWRNLHTSTAPQIRVRFGVQDHPRGAIVQCQWPADGGLSDSETYLQLDRQPRQSVAALGWQAPLELYRPFLSYAELGGLLSGKPTEMHDSLQRILGLQRLVEIEKLLKDTRRQMDEQRKLADAGLPALRAVLAEHPDPRARQAETALAGRIADLDLLDQLTHTDEAADPAITAPLRQLGGMSLPTRSDVAAEIDRIRDALHRINELAGTPAAEARSLAGLLRDALQYQHRHPGHLCPVCAGRQLDGQWATQAQAELDRLTMRAESLDDAHRTVRESQATLRHGIPIRPAVLTLNLETEQVDTEPVRIAWQQWDELLGAGDGPKIVETGLAAYDLIATALTPLNEAAQEALERRRRAWQPIAEKLKVWIDVSRKSRHSNTMYAALQKAITWLRPVGERIRNEKLAPVAGQATEIWNTLRQESNVELGGIRLAGTGPTRHVELSVNVDGVAGSALGVMSQGELHSLALALFLPRATMPQSPFRFLIIDDPVQSMDPVKVYGLAQVLDRVAKHRQVVVFTHDDRLPAAVRHLGLTARIVTVNRLADSQVTVSSDRDGDPAYRYLDDARAMANDPDIDDEIRGAVVCNLIRDALEYTSQEVIRTRDYQTGRPIAQTEAELDTARGLHPILRIALLPGNPSGDYPRALASLHPRAKRVADAANRGAHGDHRGGSLLALIDEADQVIAKLKRR